MLDVIREKYPENIKKYCEPFVGGGAVLFDVLANYNPQEVLINDINPELTDTYIEIKYNPEAVIDILSDMQEKFWTMDNEQRKAYYYCRRDRFNTLIQSSEKNEEKAALFIFLNKTCFNGLYRVNGKGFYNVPIGKYKKPSICDPDHIRLISSLLKNVEIRCGDYSMCADFIGCDTFVYIDPPYRPLNETSSFTSYTKNEFGDEQQIKLAEFVETISKKGAKVVASNSDPKNINESDDFFDNIYKKFIISRIQATRMINCNSKSRGSISELLISNY